MFSVFLCLWRFRVRARYEVQLQFKGPVHSIFPLTFLGITFMLNKMNIKTTDKLKLSVCSSCSFYVSLRLFLHFMLWQCCAYTTVRLRHKKHLVGSFLSSKEPVLLPQTRLDMVRHPLKDILWEWKLSQGFRKNIQLKNVETQTRNVVTGLAALSPLNQPPSQSPADTKLCNKQWIMNVPWHLL